MVNFRFVTWNCAGGFAKKAPRLAGLHPDMVVCCEVKRTDAEALGSDWRFIWSGAPDQKGLLIAAKAPWTVNAVF